MCSLQALATFLVSPPLSRAERGRDNTEQVLLLLISAMWRSNEATANPQQLRP